MLIRWSPEAADDLERIVDQSHSGASSGGGDLPSLLGFGSFFPIAVA